MKTFRNFFFARSGISNVLPPTEVFLYAISGGCGVNDGDWERAYIDRVITIGGPGIFLGEVVYKDEARTVVWPKGTFRFAYKNNPDNIGPPIILNEAFEIGHTGGGVGPSEGVVIQKTPCM